MRFGEWYVMVRVWELWFHDNSCINVELQFHEKSQRSPCKGS